MLSEVVEAENPNVNPKVKSTHLGPEPAVRSKAPLLISACQECKVESVSSTIRNETKIFTLATFIQCHFGSSRHDNLEKAMASHSSTLAWKISWTEEAGRLQSMGIATSWTRLSDFTFTFHFHALEKEMATYSSVLAWRIPGMGEPGGLPSMG